MLYITRKHTIPKYCVSISHAQALETIVSQIRAFDNTNIKLLILFPPLFITIPRQCTKTKLIFGIRPRGGVLLPKMLCEDRKTTALLSVLIIFEMYGMYIMV